MQVLDAQAIHSRVPSLISMCFAAEHELLTIQVWYGCIISDHKQGELVDANTHISMIIDVYLHTSYGETVRNTSL